jgi:hypothetical protein
MRAAGSPPQQGKANGHEQVSRRVKETVQERIEFQVGQRVGGIASAGDHVVPLKHLMQDDPVKETAQAQPKKDSCGYGKTLITHRRKIGGAASRLGHLATPVSAQLGKQSYADIGSLRRELFIKPRARTFCWFD